MARVEVSSIPPDMKAVCTYCANRVSAFEGRKRLSGCKEVRNRQGQYARLCPSKFEVKYAKQEGIKVKDGSKGCSKFKPSGFPVHPDIKPILVIANPLAVSIPEDSSAPIVSHDFQIALRKHTNEVPMYSVAKNGNRITTIQ